MTKRHLSDGTPVCDRCNKPTKLFKMSWFNTEHICPACQKAEESHPDYRKAKEAVIQHEQSGNRNWEGIGLPIDLKVRKW